MSKLPHIGTTIFTEMSQLANIHGAINLSQGFPNFDIDSRIKDLLANKSKEDVHQYQPMSGSPKLRKEIQSLILKSYNRFLDSENEILITSGASQGLFSSIMALVSQGDEVLILDPSYDSYAPSIILAGGVPVHVDLNENYLPNWGKIEAAVSHKTRMLIANTPHNPSGVIWRESDYLKLEELMDKFHQITFLSDEVYEYITFEKDHISAHQRSKIIDRTITVSSFGKTFHLTGWKIGYITAKKEILDEIKKVHQFDTFSVNSVSQAVLSEYLPLVEVNELGRFYQEKRDDFKQLMSKSRFKLLPCEGTYFQLADYSSISDLSDVEFCKKITIEHGVAAIPVSVFNKSKLDRKHIRFCFAKKESTLKKAAEILVKL